MIIQEPEVRATLDAAVGRIRVTVGAVVLEAPTLMLEAMRASKTYHERSLLSAAQNHLLMFKEPLIAAFGESLRERIEVELAGTATNDYLEPNASETDWSAIGLVAEDEVQGDISFGRIGQFISHECDLELRELSGFTSGLLRHGRADPERNPLRGAVVGWAMHTAIKKVTPDVSIERSLGKQLGSLVASALKPCYSAIIAEMRARGVSAAGLVARPVAESRPGIGRSAVPESPLASWERSRVGTPLASATELPQWETSSWGGVPTPRSPGEDGLPASSADLFERLSRGEVPAAMASQSPLLRTSAQAASDANLTALLRRLNQGITSISGALGQPLTESATPQSSVNLINAHRETLARASGGQLDHMVIDVVSGLFDQIFSDTQVPPEMARAIARLQLPVLRVAMRDPKFFASRRHPVRRFINRVSSLGVAIDDFSRGSGKALLERVHGLIKQIVEGDFEQVELYTSQLQELERFTAEEARAEIGSGPADATLKTKEVEWRQLGRFAEDMRAAFEPLPFEPYLKTFFAQTWAQVIAISSQREGVDSNPARRWRVTGYNLAVSTRPKRSIEERKKFIAGLAPLMAGLKEGMALVDWPESQRDAFFDKLMIDQAASLKSPPGSDLDHNLLLKRLQSTFRTPLMAADMAEPASSLAPGTVEVRALSFDQTFSAEEARNVGLVMEASVDWNHPVAQAPTPVLGAARDAAMHLPATDPGVESEFPEVTAGSTGSLRTQLAIGLSYHLQLKESWEKVRLAYMSPGRNLFLFRHGVQDRRSISMTARMLDRLCETGRMRPIEMAFLLDRASARVQQQLAGLRSTGGQTGAASA